MLPGRLTVYKPRVSELFTFALVILAMDSYTTLSRQSKIIANCRRHRTSDSRLLARWPPSCAPAVGSIHTTSRGDLMSHCNMEDLNCACNLHICPCYHVLQWGVRSHARSPFSPTVLLQLRTKHFVVRGRGQWFFYYEHS